MKHPIRVVSLIALLSLSLSRAAERAASEDKPFPETRPLVLGKEETETVIYFSDGADGDKIVHIQVSTGSAKVTLYSGDAHFENVLPVAQGNYITVKGHSIKIDRTSSTELKGSYRFEPGFVKAKPVETKTTGKEKEKEKETGKEEKEETVEGGEGLPVDPQLLPKP